MGVHASTPCGWSASCSTSPLAFIVYGAPPGGPIIASTGAGSGTALLTVEFPDPGHDAVTDIEVQFNLEGAWISLGSPGPSVQIDGLENGNAYFLRVRARNLFGVGAASDPVQVVPTDCSVDSASASSTEFSSEGASASVTVNHSAFNCSSGVTSTVDWIVLDGDGTVSGSSGDIGFTVAANPSDSVRAGILVVGDQMIPIVQHPTIACSGDLNGDGVVTGSDIGLLLLQWGPCD